MFRVMVVALGLWLVSPLRADGPNAALKLVPKQADFVLSIDSPRTAIDAMTSLDPLSELQEFSAIREAISSSNIRRLLQFVRYYEKELGHSWPDLLEKVAGRGVAIAGKFEGDNSPVLLIFQGNDEALTRKTVELFRGVLERELGKAESPAKIEQAEYRGITGYRIGKELCFAQLGSAVAISNRVDAVRLAANLFLDGPSESLAEAEGVRNAWKLLPADSLARAWINLKPAHDSEQGKTLFETPRNDVAPLIVFGGYLDVLGQSSFIAAGLTRQDRGMNLTIRAPKGRDASPEGIGLHLAPIDQPGSLPLLEPKNALYSSSFYLDLGTLWHSRSKLLQESAKLEFEETDKKFGRFLAGRKVSDLLSGAGAYHRFVAVAQPTSGYSKFPEQTIPAAAFASTFRDDTFPQAVEAALRATALVAGTPYRLKMINEDVNGIKLVGYRFPEEFKPTDDQSNQRFNFSPCFAKVGDQFFAASTMELGREMIALLQKSASKSGSASPIAARGRVYAAGAAQFASSIQEDMITQTILDRAISAEDARREVAGLIRWVKGLGTVQTQASFEPHRFQYDIQWSLPAGTSPAATGR